jgi:hypothetical protein
MNWLALLGGATLAVILVLPVKALFIVGERDLRVLR